jgi:nicotinate (nicotinamide) nucleotide adenylyltransferase
MTKNIGIYSGTFDPVHTGHIAFGNATREACRLDSVVFIPEQSPRHKSEVTGIHHRKAMLEQATAHHVGLKVALLTTSRFTVSETFPELQQLFDNAHLTFLIGSDVVRTLPRHWEGIELLLPIVSFAVGMRSGDTPEEVETLMKQVEMIHHHTIQYTLIPPTPNAEISSSIIRRGSGSDAGHIAASTEAYIQQNSLYIQK